MRHINIPVFIPHLGCPHDCVFCNQRVISGTEEFDRDSVKQIIDESLSTVGDKDECEIAFFGGSFTGIDRGLMLYLLDTAEEYVRKGRVSSIRCSTRPDYIDGEICDILSHYSVKTVELGIQSVSDAVLERAHRGHTYEDTRLACERLRACGLTVGGQMMTGLPGASYEDELETARAIVSLGCKEARVYPTLVFAGTELEYMMKLGEYEPMTLEEAVTRTSGALRILHDGGVKVLRVGLCESENLHSSRFSAGPNHPAIGELCESRIFYENIRDAIGDPTGQSITVYVPRGALSKAIGHRRQNAEKMKKEYNLRAVFFRESEELTGYGVKVEIKDVNQEKDRKNTCT